MQPRKYFTDQIVYRYFAYRRRAKVVGCPAALSTRLVKSPNRQLAGMKLTLQAPGGPRPTTHTDVLLTRRDGQSCLRTWESGKYRMKYLLNLPLAVAALLQVWFDSLVFMSAP